MGTAERHSWIRLIDPGARDPQGQADHHAQPPDHARMAEHHKAPIEQQAIGREPQHLRQVALQLQRGRAQLRQGHASTTARRQVTPAGWGLPTALAEGQSAGFSLALRRHPAPIEPRPQPAQANLQGQALAITAGMRQRRGGQDANNYDCHEQLQQAETTAEATAWHRLPQSCWHH